MKKILNKIANASITKETILKLLIGLGLGFTTILIGEALSMLVLERQIAVYYGTSFATAMLLMVILAWGFIVIKDWKDLFMFSLNAPITVCYIGFVFEIFKTGLGPALLFGIFDAEVSGILFNYSTCLSIISVGYFVIKRLYSSALK